MKKIFTDLENLPERFIPKIVEYNQGFKYTTSVDDCDYILLPFWEVINEYTDHQYLDCGLDPASRVIVKSSVERLLSLSKEFNKELLIFEWSDNESIIPIENGIFFRTSLYKSKQKINEFSLPSWKEDIIKDFNKGKLEIRKKSIKPSVGFRGSSRPLNFSLLDIYRFNVNHLNRTLSSLQLPFLVRHQWNEGQILRKQVMTKLVKNNDIRTDFKVVIRGFINQKDANKKRHNRYKFVENIFNNDYNLCVRGAGNYSYRFFETISAGRIPLFINTDCVLPLDFMIDWKKYCVWVEEDEIEKIDQILLDFHNDLSNDDFEELQVAIRTLWEEKIAPASFFNTISNHLDRVNTSSGIIL